MFPIETWGVREMHSGFTLHECVDIDTSERKKLHYIYN